MGDKDPETYIDCSRRARAEAVRCLHDNAERVVLLRAASGQEGRDAAVGAEVAEAGYSSLGLDAEAILQRQGVVGPAGRRHCEGGHRRYPGGWPAGDVSTAGWRVRDDVDEA